MRFTSLIAVLSTFFIPAAIFAATADSGSICHEEIFGSVKGTVRARASGFSFLALADDASAIFYNPSGLSTVSMAALYCDYGQGTQEGKISESRGAFILPFEDLSVAAGFYYKDSDTFADEKVLVLGLGYRLTQGTEGSFLSIGASIRLNSLSAPDSDDCDLCPFDGTDTGVSGDAGVMIRPLPMVSLSYLFENINEKRYEAGSVSADYGRSSRVGMSVFLKDSVSVSWERYIREGPDCDNFGFIMKTSVPLEIMAGFYREKVTGGLRWTGRRHNIGISFSPLEDSRVYTSVAFEFFPGSGDGER